MLPIMYHSLTAVSSAIPLEYRATVQTLFSTIGQGAAGPKGNDQGSVDQKASEDAASAFADALGIGNDFRRVLAQGTEGAELHHFLSHFQNNLDLLIQKTWVEKADEDRKEALADRLPPFLADIRAGRYQEALREFSFILDELAYLFFGPQSDEEDFTEYTLRIDTQLGLFWWYGTRMELLAHNDDERRLWPALLIGICYLTNF